MTDILNRITANEARAYLNGNWREKLNEIYDGVRAVLETGADNYTFELNKDAPFSNKLILKNLELDGYRLVVCEWNPLIYSIFW